MKTYKLLALHHVQQSSKRYPMKPKVHVLRLELLSLGRRGATCVVSSYYQRKFSGKLPIYELLGSLGMYHDMSEVFMEILLDMKVYLESCRVLVRLMILRLFQLSLFVGKEFNLCWKIEDRSEEQTTAMLTRTSWDSARNWHGKYIDTSHLIKYLVVLCLSLLLFFLCWSTLVIATLQSDPTAAWLRKVIGAANGVTLAFEGKIPWFEKAWLIQLRKTNPMWWVFVEGKEIEFLTRSRRNRMLGISGYAGVKMANVSYIHDTGECRRYLLTSEPLGIWLVK